MLPSPKFPHLLTMLDKVESLLPFKIVIDSDYSAKGSISMPTTGEKPDKGNYQCKKCGQIVKTLIHCHHSLNALVVNLIVCSKKLTDRASVVTKNFLVLNDQRPSPIYLERP